jgi:hypothetical protein
MNLNYNYLTNESVKNFLKDKKNGKKIFKNLYNF